MTIVESPQQYVRPLYQYMEGFDVEDYIAADADAYTRLKGRHIRAHLYITPYGLEYRSRT